jgi:hypothetical protein
MKNIVIIGSGELGSRHLQGVAKCTFDVKIEVVEPSKSVMKIAKERYSEMGHNTHVKSVEFYSSIDKISDTNDLVIIATSADVRCDVIKELLRKKTVVNLVLEKVLFQKIEDYYTIENLLKKAGTKCWVNHTRRMLPEYQKIKSMLKGAGQISYSYQSCNWGIGCNGLHFIDHLAFLTEESDLVLNHTFLDKSIYKSKRTGFIEFNGLLTGKLGDHVFSLYSSAKTDNCPSIFTIFSDSFIILIDEENDSMKVATKKEDWKFKLINEKIVYFQSELSQRFAKDILINEDCLLPSYGESMKLHIPFVTALLEHFNENSIKKSNILSIT